MLLDLNKPLVELDGTSPNSEVTLNKILASILSNYKSAKLVPEKVMPWAFDLFSGKTITIDETDLRSLIEFLNNLMPTPGVNPVSPLVIEQLQRAIRATLDAAKTPKPE